MTASQRIIHMLLNNAPGKWGDIHVRNLISTLTPEQARRLHKELKPLLVDKLNERIDTLIGLQAPSILIKPLAKQLRLIEQDRGILTPIRKRYEQHS